MQFEFLRSIVGLLDDAGIAHMLAGSMASTFHGEPRMSRDIDIVIDPTPKSAARPLEALDRSRYYVDDLMEAVRRREMAYLVDTESGWKADLIVRKDRPLSRAEFGRRQAAEIGGMEVFVATAEDTVLAKLEWRARSGSEQQLSGAVRPGTGRRDPLPPLTASGGARAGHARVAVSATMVAIEETRSPS